MTTAKKLSLAGELPLLTGVALMTLLHQLALWSFGGGSAQAMGMHHGMPTPHAMPWFMTVGPLALALSLGGAMLLIVSLVRLAARQS